MKTRRTKTYGKQQKHSKKKLNSNTILPQETRNISNKQPNLALKANREKKTLKVSRRKETIKIRSEIIKKK